MISRSNYLIKSYQDKFNLACMPALWVIGFLLLSTLLSGQQYYTRHFTVKNGLPSNSVRCVFLDSRGLLWIGTDAGLCTYDGREFHNFGKQEGFLLDNVWAITEDDQGRLWIGSHGQGLCRYDRKQFLYYKKATNQIRNDWIRTLHFSKRHNCLMIGSEEGVDVFRHDSLIKPVLQPKLPYRMVITDFTESGDFILVNIYGILDYLYYPATNQMLQRVITEDGDYPPNASQSLITKAGDSILGYGRSGFMVKRKAGGKCLLFNKIGQVFGLAEDNKSRIWVAAWSYGMLEPGGLYLLDGDSLHAMNEKLGIPSQMGWSVFYDPAQRLLWYSTEDNGLFLIQDHTIITYPPAAFGLKSFTVKDVFCSDDNNIWIASDSSLIRRSASGQVKVFDNKAFFESYLRSLKPELAFKYRNDKNFRNLAVSSIRNFVSIDTDIRGNQIISTEAGMIRIAADDSFQYFLFGAGCRFVILPGDTLVYGQWLDLNMVTNPWQDKERSFLRPGFTGEAPGGNVGHIRRNGNEVWYCSWVNGFYRSIGTHFTNPGKNPGMPTSIKDICFDRANRQIIGANDGSIFQTGYRNAKFQVYRILNLASEMGTSINWLMFDKEQDLWIGTNKGLACLDYPDWDKSGVVNLRFWDQSEGYAATGSLDACWDNDGKLWTGYEEGLVHVDVHAMKASESRKLKVVLTELEIGGLFTRSDASKGHIFSGFEKGDTLQEILLQPDDRDLTFYYDVYNYVNPEKDFFRYILEGYDRDWSEWKQNRRVRYTNLPPGNYILRIESKNISTGAMASSHTTRLRIQSPWYARWQSVTIALVLLVLLVWFTFRWRVRIANAKVRRSVQAKQRMIELELRTLQNQINPHFMFNSLNSLQNFILDNKTDDALEFLGDFANLLRKTFEFSTRKQVILAEYINLLEGYLKLEKLRFGEKIDYKIRVHESLDPQSVLIIPLVLQPFVENAVKHGLHHKTGLGHIDIYIHRPEIAILECIVEDNGIGREASAKLRKFTTKDNNSLGIAITNERIKLLNQESSRQDYGVTITDLTEEDGSAAGTRVVIRLPYWPL